MLSELGTSCHGKTATGKGYTKMLVTGGGGGDDGTGLSSMEMLSKSLYQASLRAGRTHPAPAPACWDTTAVAMRARCVPWATHEQR